MAHAFMHRLQRIATPSSEMLDAKPTQINDEVHCACCNSTNIVEYEAYHVCMDCQSTVDQDIDYRPDWNRTAGSRSNLQKNDRLPQSSMSTVIYSSKSTKLSKEMKRMFTWNSTPHNERALKIKIADISIVCKTNHVSPAISEYAQDLYAKLVEQMGTLNLKKKRGNNDIGLQGAALFVSFQSHRKPRTYQEIATMFGIDSHYVSSGINTYNEIMEKAEYSRSDKQEDFVQGFAECLKLEKKYVDRVFDVMGKANELCILENNTPISVVAGCIYYVVNEYGLSINAQTLQDLCKVSVPTINKVYDKLNRRSIDLL